MNCTADQLAEMLGLTKTRVLQLVKTDVVVKINPLEYDIIRSVKNYIGTIKTAPVLPEGIAPLSESKARRELAQAGLAELKLAEAKAELIPIAEADARDAKIGSAIRSAVLRQRAELPPRLEGLQAHQIASVMDEYNRNMLEELSDERSEFWQ